MNNSNHSEDSEISSSDPRIRLDQYGFMHCAHCKQFIERSFCTWTHTFWSRKNCGNATPELKQEAALTLKAEKEKRI